MSAIDLESMRRHILETIEENVKKLRMAEAIAQLDLPEEASVSMYDIAAYGWVSVNIRYAPHLYGKEAEKYCNDLPWAERVKPIGKTLRAFKAHKIERNVSSSGMVTYQGQATLDGREITLAVQVLFGGISPTCKVETIKETRLVETTKVVVTCN